MFFRILALLFAPMAMAQSVHQTYIVRGPDQSTFSVPGKVNCLDGFNAFVEKTGFNELYKQRDHLLANAVELKMCEYDGQNTTFELYAKFTAGDDIGENLLQDVIKRRSGTDFYGNPITFETPTHFALITTFEIFDETSSRRLRDVQLVPNDNEYTSGEAFAARARSALDSSASYKDFENLVQDQFGSAPPDFMASLHSATYISMKKTAVYFFESKANRQTLDWWWQFWGASRDCTTSACPKP